MIRSISRARVAVLALAFSIPVHAQQFVSARDGESVLARISQKEVTRITFEQGRVRKVTGNAGEFVLEKDDDRGQIFIRPASADATKPINLFVSSDQSTVGLVLQPIDAPSDSIVIREVQAPAAHAPRLGGRSHRHIRAVKNLLLAMTSDANSDRMELREINQELVLWPGLRLTLVRSLLGTELVGEKYLLVNVSAQDISIAARDLYKPGVIAVSLESETLRTGEAVPLFVIRERRPND